MPQAFEGLIMSHIERIFESSHGPELGTVSTFYCNLDHGLANAYLPVRWNHPCHGL